MIRVYKYITRTRHLHSCFWSRFCLYISDVAPFCFLGGGGFVRYPIHAPYDSTVPGNGMDGVGGMMETEQSGIHTWSESLLFTIFRYIYNTTISF